MNHSKVHIRVNPRKCIRFDKTTLLVAALILVTLFAACFTLVKTVWPLIETDLIQFAQGLSISSSLFS